MSKLSVKPPVPAKASETAGVGDEGLPGELFDELSTAQ